MPCTPSPSTGVSTTPATRDYIARRLAEGKTSRDAVLLLKRYLARPLYRLLNHEPTMT